MISELTAEERVTKILSSYQVLKNPNNSPITNEVENLGDYLETAPKIDILEEMNIKRRKPSDSRFAFVSTQWKIK